MRKAVVLSLLVLTALGLLVSPAAAKSNFEPIWPTSIRISR
ncbi:MAG TPA: hypothetical protein VK464_06645 [Symbiobacteriaceae bacterium]|jgi:hypothetical protein|nr:hypothetical protein [Symbiobacteriaceae bacterium]